MFDGIRNTLLAAWLVTAVGMTATAIASQSDTTAEGPALTSATAPTVVARLTK